VDGPTLYGLAHTLLQCARFELDACDAPPTRTYVTTGEIVWDDCCADGGQLVVSIKRTFNTDTFPATVATPLVCQNWEAAADLEVQIVRCAPTYNDDGEPPTTEQLNESALLVINDAAAVRRGVTCCLLSMLDAGVEITDAIVNEQSFVGPQGGCVGSSLFITIGVLEVCDCG